MKLVPAYNRQPVFADSYVAEVNRAIEELATSLTGIRSFGDMVSRRTVECHSDERAGLVDIL